MKLSFDLIEKSTLHCLDKIDTIEKTDCPDLFLTSDFLHPQLLDKLITFVTTTDLAWEKETYQEYKNRQKIHYISDTVIEEVHTVLENLTSAINTKFIKNNRFLGLTIWKDQEGFLVEPHDRDNEIIDLSLQIYLTGGAYDLGTKFEYNDQTIQARYIKNHGYLYNNIRGVKHYMDIPIPKNYTRYSLYAMWSRIT